MTNKVMLVWLHENENLWYTTAPGDEFLLELFGTDTVPTLFFGTTPLEQVLKGLRAANPTYEVLPLEQGQKILSIEF